MKLALITSGHQPYQGKVLEKSARRVGLEVIPYATEKPWPNDYRVGKILDALECIRQLPDCYTHVMHVDCSDTLILAPEEEILDRWAGHFYSGVLVSAEKNCHPKAELAKEYQIRYGTVLPWRYVNSGGWMATRQVIEQALPVVSELATFCDQLCWTMAYLHRVTPTVTLDEGCTIFQTMFQQQPGDFEFRNGRLHNLITQQTPCAIHWNGTRGHGRISMRGMWACIDLQQRKVAWSPPPFTPRVYPEVFIEQCIERPKEDQPA